MTKSNSKVKFQSNVETKAHAWRWETKIKKTKIMTRRRLQDICVLMYKVKHTKMCYETIANIFKPRDSCYSLRHSDFLLPGFNTVSFGKHSLRYVGPILWSKLDKNDKPCKSLSEFKNRMRNMDLTSLIDDGCKGCLLCDSWCLIGKF